MDSAHEPDTEHDVPGWAYILGLAFVILVNVLIFFYLFVYWPNQCEQLVAITAGRQTCGLQSGAYVVGAINVFVIVVCLALAVRYQKRKAE